MNGRNRKSSRPARGVDPLSSQAAQENVRFGGRHYRPADLGPLCAAGCGTRIVQALQRAGITEHPTCDRTAIRQAAR